MFNWIKTKTDAFEAWVASWLPGAKTKITAAFGALGATAAATQEYVSGLPLNQLVQPRTAMFIAAGLFTLTYWFRRLGDR